MKKICEYIDNNFKLCLILFAVIFGFSALTQPFAFQNNVLTNFIGALYLIFCNTGYYFSDPYIICYVFALFIIIAFYIVLHLQIKQESNRIKHYIIIACIFNVLMLILTLFSLTAYTIINGDFSISIFGWLEYLPSIFGFLVGTIFSIAYCAHNFDK